jgi:hypothetical protein
MLGILPVSHRLRSSTMAAFPIKAFWRSETMSPALWCTLILLFQVYGQSNASSCLPNAIVGADRKNVSVGDGLPSMHLKLASVTWVSGSLLGHAARIILQEKLGYNVEFAPPVGQSRRTWMQVADCNSTEPNDKCFQGPPGSVAHLAFEIWESYGLGMPEKMAKEVPGRVPFVVGHLGALGTEAFFIRKAKIQEASEKALFLQWYQSYNVSWSTAHNYFVSHTDLPDPDTACQDVNYMQGSYLDDYVKYTGDSQAVTVKDGKKTRVCDAKGWALSPACRKLMAQGAKGCIPAICYGGWGFHDLAQKAAFFDMPLALGAYGWSQYIAIPKANSTLTYWWTPDAALLNSDPIEVVFPAYDADEYGSGIYKSAMAGTPLQKISSSVIANEVIVQQFVKQMVISIQSVMRLTTLAEGRPSSEHEQVACNWLKNNGKIWNKWLPDPTDCIAKQGLMDKLGNFMTVANAANATQCKFCAAGRRSDDVQTAKGPNFICEQCEPGRFQSNLGETSCAVCGAGTYSKTGAVACEMCEIGSFSSIVEASNCSVCPGSFTTQYRSTKSMSACQCPAGSYRDSLNRGLCKDCPEGMTCAFGSDVAAGAKIFPLLEPKFWSSVSNPTSVFRCDNEFRCPGGAPGTCGSEMVGPSCARCSDGWDFDGEVCYECADVEKTIVLFPILPMILVPALVCFMYKVFGDSYEKWGSWRNGLGGLAFIALNHFQIITMLKTVNMQLPDVINFHYQFFAFSADIGSLFKPDCASFDLNKVLIVKTIFPAWYLGMGVVTWLFSKLVAKCCAGARMEGNRAFNAVVSLMLTFFLGMVSLSVTLFVCKSNPNGTSSLAVDRSITCFEDTWSGLLSIGIVAVLVWCVGVATVFAWATFTMPARMHEEKIRMRWKFLFLKFRPDRYWWALAFLARGFMLNIGLIAVQSGCAQIFWMMIVLTLYQLAAVICMPWRHMVSNLVDISAVMFLILSASCLLWFAKDQLNDADRAALDTDIINFCVAFSLVVFVFLIGAGLKMMYSQTSAKALARKQDTSAMIRKSLRSLSAADDQVLQSFLMKLPEWDYWFTAQCASVISFEYLGEKALRSGYITVSLDDAEKQKRKLDGESENSGHSGKMLPSLFDAPPPNTFESAEKEDCSKPHNAMVQITGAADGFALQEFPQADGFFYPRQAVTTPRTPVMTPR